jgi:ABC-type dipeptide/oligopeptide/nickel transport system permease component
MHRYIIRRLIAMPLLLLGVVTVAFIIAHATHADPLASLVNERVAENPEVIAAAKKRWGLDRSLPEQYVIYVANLVTGDLGTSFRTKRQVSEDLLDRLPATLELVVAAMILGTLMGVSLGVLAAARRNRLADHASRLFALLGSSIPVFWSGLLLLFLFTVEVHWLPGPGRLDPHAEAPLVHTGFLTVDSLLAGNFLVFVDALWHLALPAFVLGWAVMGIISRLVRASMLDVLSQDYVLMARAKGAGELRVLLNHALRNALIPTLTVIGFSFAYLITGAVLTETIFSWPGIGSYAVDSARSLDYPAIMGVTVVGAAAFLLSSLATDVAYVFVDPKIKLA